MSHANLNDIGGEAGKQFPMQKEMLDKLISDVMKETLEKLSTFLKDSKHESELTQDHLRKWFAFTISSLHGNNTAETEKRYNEIKNDILDKFMDKTKNDVESNDGKEINSLIRKHVVFKGDSHKGSDIILCNLTQYLNVDNKKAPSSVLTCFKCSSLDESKADIVDNNSMLLYDYFDALIKIQPCSICNLDPRIFKNARTNFDLL